MAFDAYINAGDFRHSAYVERNEPVNVGGITSDNWVAYIDELRVARKTVSHREFFREDTTRDYVGEVFYARRFSAGKRIVPGMRLTVYDENAQTDITYLVDYVKTPNNIRAPYAIHAREIVAVGEC